MRTIVDIPDEQVRRLDADAKKHGISRAECVRRAVDLYLSELERREEAFRSAFGSWKHLNLDTDKFLSDLRDEWER